MTNNRIFGNLLPTNYNITLARSFFRFLKSTNNTQQYGCGAFHLIWWKSFKQRFLIFMHFIDTTWISIFYAVGFSLFTSVWLLFFYYQYLIPWSFQIFDFHSSIGDSICLSKIFNYRPLGAWKTDLLCCVIVPLRLLKIIQPNFNYCNVGCYLTKCWNWVSSPNFFSIAKYCDCETENAGEMDMSVPYIQN